MLKNSHLVFGRAVFLAWESVTKPKETAWEVYLCAPNQVKLSTLRYDITTDLDDPATTLRHREIILTKPFLKKIYEEWYAVFAQTANENPKGKFLEIGSGGGFLDQVIPALITSDILPLPHCRMTFSAEAMPFGENELDGIFMLNVFHHIPKPHLFLAEAQRTLKPGGRIVMTEPANSFFGRFIYRNFHHEPFEPTGGWEIESTGPLSGSNQALPYIYFERDRKKMEAEFPQLKIRSIRYHTPLRYLLSGGVSRRPLMPTWSFGFWKGVEWCMSPLSRAFGMFATYELEKINT